MKDMSDSDKTLREEGEEEGARKNKRVVRQSGRTF